MNTQGLSSPSSPRDTSLTMDLRHMTSLGALSNPSPSSRRTSQHIARSPSSIPSSPTSAYSSSSAIFERDIEPLHPTTFSARAKHQERENSVPSVLDAAASVLASAAEDDLVVVSPLTSPGWGSPMGSLSSRSPSPSWVARTTRSASLSPMIMPLDIPSPTSSPCPSPLPLSHTNTNTNRLSFLSYTDLLSSAPSALQPLSALTTAPRVLSPSSPASRAPSVYGRESMLFPDGAGGEWEREGLGRGLEARLEAVM